MKKLEVDLVAQGLKGGDQKATKKLMDEKDKQIKALQTKFKFSVTDHPQTEEIYVVQNKCDALKDEVLELKSKLLNVT